MQLKTLPKFTEVLPETAGIIKKPAFIMHYRANVIKVTVALATSLRSFCWCA